MVLNMNITFERHQPTILLQEVAKTSSELTLFKDNVPQLYGARHGDECVLRAVRVQVKHCMR